MITTEVFQPTIYNCICPVCGESHIYVTEILVSPLIANRQGETGFSHPCGKHFKEEVKQNFPYNTAVIKVS
jgi:hypothetical protein